jgi:YkoY family integral membrane protein
LYAKEFRGMWGISLSDLPIVGWYVLVLVFLEGLLSADNALVLAVLVRHLPRQEQRRALRYGIWGAFGFRLLAVLASSLLLKFWGFKLVGGLYLLYLALSHFVWGGHDDESDPASCPKSKRFGGGFWGTVISVELADIAFSIDSILAAVAMADGLPARLGANWRLAIVYLGGVLGIVTMRFVAGYFIILLERFTGLANGAYILVAWIGLKLIVSGLHSAHYVEEMPEWLFWSVMMLIVVGSMLIRPRSALKFHHLDESEPLDQAAEVEGEGASASTPGANAEANGRLSGGLASPAGAAPNPGAESQGQTRLNPSPQPADPTTAHEADAASGFSAQAVRANSLPSRTIS